VNVGIIYTDQSQANARLGAFGANDLVYGDLLAEQKAVINYINGHGGVARGRKLVPVPYNATTDSSPQSLCTYWTEDHKVFTGIYPGGQVESADGVSCMKRHHAMLIQSPFDPGDKSFFNTYGAYYYAVSGLEAIRMGRDYVNGLFDQGFYTGGKKIGLLYYDVPSLRSAYAQGVKPALASHGLQLSAADTYAITYPYKSSDDAAAVRAVQSAELRFAADGVDRVMFLDAGAGLAFFFIQNAKTQNYKPKYGFESGSNPSFIDQNFTASDLTGSLGVGWLPAGDVDSAFIPDNPARKLCRDIMRKAGQPPQSQSDLYAQYDMCATFFFLKEGLDHATSVSAEGLQAGLTALGNAPNASADTLGSGYAPDKHWGARQYYWLRYDPGSGSFKYYGKAHPV
jgi:hypothetical protein